MVVFAAAAAVVFVAVVVAVAVDTSSLARDFVAVAHIEYVVLEAAQEPEVQVQLASFGAEMVVPVEQHPVEQDASEK